MYFICANLKGGLYVNVKLHFFGNFHQNVIVFSELALVTHKPRAASAYAVGTVKCAGEYHNSKLPLLISFEKALGNFQFVCVSNLKT